MDMIEVIKNIPSKVVGFCATGEVTKADYEEVEADPQYTACVFRFGLYLVAYRTGINCEICTQVATDRRLSTVD